MKKKRATILILADASLSVWENSKIAIKDLINEITDKLQTHDIIEMVYIKIIGFEKGKHRELKTLVIRKRDLTVENYKIDIKYGYIRDTGSSPLCSTYNILSNIRERFDYIIVITDLLLSKNTRLEEEEHCVNNLLKIINPNKFLIFKIFPESRFRSGNTEFKSRNLEKILENNNIEVLYSIEEIIYKIFD